MENKYNYTEPLISVIMSTYDEKIKWVDEAVRSILSQTYRNIEFVIIVDKPDNSELIDYLYKVEQEDNRVKILINKENLGLAKGRNIAIKASTGDYIAIMDADDVSEINRFEREYKCLCEKKCDMVYSRTTNIDEDSIFIKENVWENYNYKQIEVYLKHIGDIVVHPSVLIKKDVLTSLDGYRHFDCAMDYDMWLRVVDAGYKIGFCNEALLKYRKRSGSITGKGKYKQLITSKYILKLDHERKIKGKDSFSYAKYQEYLTRYHVEQKGVSDAYFFAVNEYIKHASCAKRNVKGFFPFFCLLFKSKVAREQLITSLKNRYYFKIIEKYNVIS